MEKLFIPYKQALALKELGFDELCLAWYSSCGSGKLHIGEGYKLVTREERCNVMEYSLHNSNFEYGKNKPSFSYLLSTAPTYEQAFDWFRKKHKLHSEIELGEMNKFYWILIKSETTLEKIYGSNRGIKTYPKAKLDCLKELIKIAKKK